MLDILPQNLFSNAAIKGREKLVKSYAVYYNAGNYQQGAVYIRAFIEHCITYNIHTKDILRMLVGTVLNNVANTVPSASWVIYRIYNDRGVREQCRNEVLHSIQYSDDGKTAIIIK